MSIHIRPATVSDHASIAAYNAALALETESLRLDPYIISRGVQAILDDPAKGQYYVAQVDNLPGYGIAGWRGALD